MATINSSIILDVNANQVTAAVAQLTGLSSAASAATGMMAGLGAAVAGISVGAIASAVKDTLEWGDALLETAQRLGVTTDKLQQLQSLAFDMNTDVKALTGSFESSQKMIGLFELGNAKAAKAMGLLGTEVINAIRAGKDSTEIFLLQIKALSEYSDVAERTAAAQRNGLGPAALDMAAAFREGKMSLEELIQKQKEATIATQKELEEASKLNDKWDKMINNLNINMKSALLDFIDHLDGVDEQVKKSAGYITSLADTIHTFLVIIGQDVETPFEKYNKETLELESRAKLLAMAKKSGDTEAAKIHQNEIDRLEESMYQYKKATQVKQEYADTGKTGPAGATTLDKNDGGTGGSGSSSKDKWGIDRDALERAMVKQESGGDSNATSSKGARGKYQFMPDTWATYGEGSFDNASNDAKAKKAYDKFMDMLLEKAGGDLVKALIGYNSGQNKKVVSQAGPADLSKENPETRDYVPNVLTNYKRETSSSMQNANDDVASYQKQVRQKETEDKKYAIEKERLADKMARDEKSIHDKTLQMSAQAADGKIAQSRKTEEVTVQLINEELVARRKAGTLFESIEKDLQTQITLAHQKGTNDRIKIETDAKQINDALVLQERKVASDTASAVQKYTQDTQILVARSEQTKLGEIKAANIAAMNAIEDRYKVESGRAKLTADQVKQLEKDKAAATAAQNKINSQEMARSGNAGYGAALYQDVQDEIKQTGNLTQNLADETKNAFLEMGDAFVGYVNGSKASFADFAKSFIIEIEKMIAKQLILNALSMVTSGLGFASGGTVGAGNTAGLSGGVPTNFNMNMSGAGFASGGIIDQPTGLNLPGGRIGVGGEAGPEAIMPLSRGPDGKLGVSGGSVQQKNFEIGGITVNVQAPKDANAQQHGELISATVKRQLQEYLHSEIKDSFRPGNNMNRNRTIGGGAMSI